MKPPICRLCGQAHWAHMPHIFPGARPVAELEREERAAARDKPETAQPVITNRSARLIVPIAVPVASQSLVACRFHMLADG